MPSTYTDSTGAVLTLHEDGTVTSPGAPTMYDPGFVETAPQQAAPAAAPTDFLRSPLGRAIAAGLAGSFAAKFLGVEGNSKTLFVAGAAYMGWKGEFDLIGLIL
jgi:hypothetical protein